MMGDTPEMVDRPEGRRGTVFQQKPISESIEETITQLDALHAPIEARKRASFEALRLAVAAYDVPPPTQQGEEGEPWRAERPPERRGSEPEPFVPLPRTRPHHEFGPAVRRRLIAEALERERW